MFSTGSSDKKKAETANPATNTQNTNPESEGMHQPVSPLTTAPVRKTPASVAREESPSPPLSPETEDERDFDEKAYDYPAPLATYRNSIVLVTTPATFEEKRSLLGSSTPHNIEFTRRPTLLSSSSTSSGNRSGFDVQREETSHVRDIFGLTLEQAYQALSKYCQESKEKGRGKHYRVKSIVAYEVRAAFLRSYTNLHFAGNEHDALSESMQRSAASLLSRYAQVNKDWEQTLREINENLERNNDIRVEDKSFEWLLNYYGWLSNNGTKGYFLESMSDLPLGDKNRALDNTIYISAYIPNKGHTYVVRDLEHVVQTGTLPKDINLNLSDLPKHRTDAKLMEKIIAVSSTAGHTDTSSNEASKRYKELKSLESMENESHEKYVRDLNQKLKSEGAFKPNLGGNELLMHFQRLYFEESTAVAGDKTQSGYARRGTPASDKRYQTLIAAKRKLVQVEMQLDEYCYLPVTQQVFLTERFKKDGRLDLLWEDHTRSVDELEAYMIQQGHGKAPDKLIRPVPSMLDALAEDCQKIVYVWEKAQDTQQPLQLVHHYIPTDSSGGIIHVVHEGNTYRKLDVIPSIPQSESESYTVDPAYLDMCRWRDRFFWEAVVAINKAIKKELGSSGEDALDLLELLLGDNAKRAQEESRELHQDRLFELVYQKTFQKLVTTIKATLELHGERQRQERCFTYYQREISDSTAIHAQEVQKNQELIDEKEQELSRAARLLGPDRAEVVIKECEVQANALARGEMDILDLEERLNPLPFADYEKSPLRSQLEKAKAQRKDREKALTQYDDKRHSVILLQSQLAVAKHWKQQWANHFDKWLAKEKVNFARMREKYQELWNICEPKGRDGHPLAVYDPASGKAGVDEYLDILKNEEHPRYVYHHLAKASYERVMKYFPFALPPQDSLSAKERRETVDELMQQINMAIAFSSVLLEQELNRVMAIFRKIVHYPISEAAKHGSTVYFVAEQHVERLKHWALHFLQGSRLADDGPVVYGSYLATFKRTGDLTVLIASLGQSILKTKENTAKLSVAADNYSLSEEKAVSQTRLGLSASIKSANKKANLLPFHYQGRGQDTRSPEQMVHDIQATRIGSLSFAHVALADTGDTLMHFALLAYNKVQGKQKERLFKIIGSLFARGADSNVRNTHTAPQTARQLAKLTLVVPEDLKLVTTELEHQRHYNDFEAAVADKLTQYCQETRSQFSSRSFLERLLFTFKKSEKALQKRRVQDVHVIIELLQDARQRLDDTQLNTILQFMLQEEETHFVHKGQLQAKFQSTVDAVNSAGSSMTYFGPLIKPKIDISREFEKDAKDQEQGEEQGAAAKKQAAETTKQAAEATKQAAEATKQVAEATKQVAEAKKQAAGAEKRDANKERERLTRLMQQLDAQRRDSEAILASIVEATKGMTDVPRKFTEAEAEVRESLRRNDRARDLLNLGGSSANLAQGASCAAPAVEGRRAQGLFSNSSSSANIAVSSVESQHETGNGNKPLS